jgi:EPS-associated MarR family transcriptional regulator
MELSEKSFQILDALDSYEIFNQRQLAEHSGVSLSQVNYLLKRLLEKGLVKIKNFQKNPRKTTYLYLLTPDGMEAKSRAAVRFVKSRLREYTHLREALTKKLTSIEKGAPVRIIFVGPPMVKDFVDSLIKERRLKLILANHYNNWKDLKEIDPESFDTALLFDGNSEGLKKISDNLNIPEKKLTVLW